MAVGHQRCPCDRVSFGGEGLIRESAGNLSQPSLALVVCGIVLEGSVGLHGPRLTPCKSPILCQTLSPEALHCLHSGAADLLSHIVKL